MNETELLLACRDIRLLGWVWFGLMIGAGSMAFSFAALYQFGVRVRLPRMRATLKRLAAERSGERAARLAAEEQASSLRTRMETVGLEAQKEIARVDAIRRKTEQRLSEQNGELQNERDLTASLQALLEAQIAPGQAESWVP